MNFKSYILIFALCFVQCLSKPATEHELTEGRGIGSTIWSWVTYPFSWWSSSEPELPPINDQLIGSTPSYPPLDTIEIGRHNVTIWCNDQTCTTQKCDKFICRNITCNIYDTDMMGECREYNTISTREEPIAKPTESMPKPSTQDKATEDPSKVPGSTPGTSTSSAPKETPPVEEHPLELEVVLSSTVAGNDEKSADVKLDAKLEQKV